MSQAESRAEPLRSEARRGKGKLSKVPTSEREAHRDVEGRARRLAATHGRLELGLARRRERRLVEAVAQALQQLDVHDASAFVDRELNADLALDAGSARGFGAYRLRHTAWLGLGGGLFARIEARSAGHRKQFFGRRFGAFCRVSCGARAAAVGQRNAGTVDAAAESNAEIG